MLSGFAAVDSGFPKKSYVENHLDIFHKIMVFLNMVKGIVKNDKKTPRQTPTQKMPKAFFVHDLGNRQIIHIV